MIKFYHRHFAQTTDKVHKDLFFFLFNYKKVPKEVETIAFDPVLYYVSRDYEGAFAMYVASNWKEYEVIDTSAGEKLERWGDFVLLRPDPQIIWDSPKTAPAWKKLNAHYHRSAKGGGEWEFFDLPQQWQIHYDLEALADSSTDARLTFNLKPFSFKHTGLFPEQAVNWEWCAKAIQNALAKDPSRNIRVLNLVTYTGGATCACAKAGAHVTHVDASKGMVQWAKENAKDSGIEETSTRWLVDDCRKFVEREIRRGNRYDAIIMDPPSYGRGPKGEIWKIEDNIYEFIRLCSQLLSGDALFFLINSYTTGLQPAVLSYMLSSVLIPEYGGTAAADEIGLPVTETGLILPAGAAGRWWK